MSERMSALLVFVLLLCARSATPNNDTQDVSGYYTSLYQEYVECRSSGTIESPRYPMPIDADDFCVYVVSLHADSCNDTVIKLQLERETFHLNHWQNSLQVLDGGGWLSVAEEWLSKPEMQEFDRCWTVDTNGYPVIAPVLCGGELAADVFNFTSTGNVIAFIVKVPHPGAFFRIKYWAMEASENEIIPDTASTVPPCKVPSTPAFSPTTHSVTSTPTTQTTIPASNAANTAAVAPIRETTVSLIFNAITAPAATSTALVSPTSETTTTSSTRTTTSVTLASNFPETATTSTTLISSSTTPVTTSAITTPETSSFKSAPTSTTASPTSTRKSTGTTKSPSSASASRILVPLMMVPFLLIQI